MSFHRIDKHNPLILASASPRRKQLLDQIGLPFMVIPSRIDEDEDNGDPVQQTLLLAENKTRAVFRDTKGQWILGADTIVVNENEILGKPENRAGVLSTLRRLSGGRHEVITGFCVLAPSGLVAHSEAVSTTVEFRELEDDEIAAYADTGEPYGKAGSYAIQGIGGFMVKGIRGSYTNVVGLPVCALVTALKKCGALGSFPFPKTLS